MWFIGALVGGGLGAAAFGFSGFVLGALFGGVVGGFALLRQLGKPK